MANCIGNSFYFLFFQEQWRCMHTSQQHSDNYVLETNYLINYFENPDVEKIDFDCPVIDPNDPEWCPENSNGEYYRVNCKIYFLKNYFGSYKLIFFIYIDIY